MKDMNDYGMTDINEAAHTNNLDFKFLYALKQDDVNAFFSSLNQSYLGNNPLSTKTVLEYCIKFGSEQILFELIKKSIFEKNELSDNHFIQSLKDLCDQRNYPLANTLLTVFVSEAPGQGAPQNVPAHVSATLVGLFFLIAKDRSINNKRKLSLIVKLMNYGLPIDELYFSCIVEKNEYIFKLIQCVFNIKHIPQTNKLNKWHENIAYETINNSMKLKEEAITVDHIELLQQTFSQKNYFGVFKLISKTNTNVLIDFYRQISLSNKFDPALLPFLWCYGFYNRADFYKKLLKTLTYEELFNSKNPLVSRRAFIDYLGSRNHSEDDIEFIFNQYSEEQFVNFIQIALELDKKNILELCLNQLQKTDENFENTVRGIIQENTSDLQLRLVKYLKELGYVYKHIDTGVVKGNLHYNTWLFGGIADDGQVENYGKFLSKGRNQIEPIAIPEYTWQEIYSYLPQVDKANFSLVCLYFKNIADNQPMFFKQIETQAYLQTILDTIKEIKSNRSSVKDFFRSYLYQFPIINHFRFSPYRLIPWAGLARLLDNVLPNSLLVFTSVEFWGTTSEIGNKTSSEVSTLDMVKMYGNFGPMIILMTYQFAIFMLSDTNRLKFQIRAFDELITQLKNADLLDHKNISKNMLLEELERVIEEFKEKQFKIENTNAHQTYYAHEIKQLFFTGSRNKLVYDIEVNVDSLNEVDCESSDESKDEEVPLNPKNKPIGYGGIQWITSV